MCLFRILPEQNRPDAMTIKPAHAEIMNDQRRMAKDFILSSPDAGTV
jgi:hypothetical protein